MDEPKPINKKRKSPELAVYPNVNAHYNREMYLDIKINDEIHPILLSDEQMTSIIQKYQDGLFEKRVKEAIAMIHKKDIEDQESRNNLIG